MRPVSAGTFVYEIKYKGSFVITTEQINAGSMLIKVASNAQYWLYVPEGYDVSDEADPPDTTRVDDTHGTVNIGTSDGTTYNYVVYKKHLITGATNLKLTDADSNEHTIEVVSDATCDSHVDSDRSFLEVFYNVETVHLNAFYLESRAQQPMQTNVPCIADFTFRLVTFSTAG